MLMLTGVACAAVWLWGESCLCVCPRLGAEFGVEIDHVRHQHLGKQGVRSTEILCTIFVTFQ